MNFKLNNVFIYVTLFLLNGCQNDINTDYLAENDIELNIYFKAVKNEIHKLANKIQNISFHKKKSLSNHSFSNAQRDKEKTSVKNPIFISLDRMQENSYHNSKNLRNKLPVFKIEQMPFPFLHPNGNSDIDLYFKNFFFRILEMQETLRNLIEYYNIFTIKTNLNFLSHPAQIDNSTEIKNLIKLRNVVSEEIYFVKNEINNYNSRINTYFPNVNINHKKAGYYSYDNSHFLHNQLEFSIEDIDNFSYCFNRKIVNEDLLKLKNPKLKLKKPEVGSRRGTVFVNTRKPNIVRGSLGNDFGAYSLGIAVGMTIEYAITGKIYYYKNAF